MNMLKMTWNLYDSHILIYIYIDCIDAHGTDPEHIW